MPKTIRTQIGGLAVATAHQQVQPPSLSIADNVDFRARASARKLPGHEALAPLPNATQVAYREDELVAWADGSLHTYRDDQWETVAAAPTGECRYYEAAPGLVTRTFGHALAIGDLVLTHWVTGGFNAYAVHNRVTREVLVPGINLQSFAGDTATVLAANDVAWLLVYQQTGTIRLRWVYPGDPGTPTATLNIGTAGDYETLAVATAYNGDFLLSSLDVSGNTLRLWRIDSYGVIRQATHTVPACEAGTNAGIADIEASGTVVWAAVRNGAGIVYEVFDAELNSIDSGISGLSRFPDHVAVAGAPASVGDVADILWDYPTPSLSATLTLCGRTRYDAVTGGDTETVAFLNDVRLYTSPLWYEGVAYLWCTIPTANTASKAHVLISYDETTGDRGGVVARAYSNDRAVLLGGATTPSGDVEQGMARTPQMSGATLLAGLQYTEGDIVAVGWTETDLSHPVAPTALANGSLYWVRGGHTTLYDGAAIYEADAHILPEATITYDEGGPAGVSTFGFALYWYSRDSQGREWRSAPYFFTHTFDFQTSRQVVVRLQGSARSTRPNLTVRCAQTIEDGDPLTGSYFEMTSSVNSLNGNPAQPGTVIISSFDVADDPTPTGPEYLQTPAGGILVHNAVPSGRTIAVLRDRLWTGDPEKRDVLHYSQPFRDGFSVEFNSTEILGTELRGGLTALAEQDGIHYAFTENLISLWSGTGPDNRGAGVAWPQPRRLPTAIGSTSQLTIANAPFGVVYGSSQGPRVVARDQASRAPFAVISELFEFSGQTISRALYLPSREQVVLYSPETDSTNLLQTATHPPRTLRYDLSTQRWSTESDAQATSADQSISGDVTLLRDNGVIARITPSIYTRGGPASAIVGTAWVTLGVDRDFTVQRIGIWGRFFSAHTLHVALGYDYEDSLSDHYVIETSPSGLRAIREWQGETGRTWSGGTSPGDPGNTAEVGGWGGLTTHSQELPGGVTSYKWRCSSANRQCHAVRVCVWDTGGEGASFALSGVTLQVLPRTGDELAVTLDSRLEF